MHKDHTLSEIHSIRSEYQKATSGLAEVAGHLCASKSTLERFEPYAYTWREECRTLILRSREKDSRYEAVVSSLKSDTTSLAGEIVTLRTHISSGPHFDEALRAKCTQLQLAIEHENKSFTIRILIGRWP